MLICEHARYRIFADGFEIDFSAIKGAALW
jgi:hypothetical protein